MTRWRRWRLHKTLGREKSVPLPAFQKSLMFYLLFNPSRALVYLVSQTLCIYQRHSSRIPNSPHGCLFLKCLRLITSTYKRFSVSSKNSLIGILIIRTWRRLSEEFIDKFFTMMVGGGGSPESIYIINSTFLGIAWLMVSARCYVRHFLLHSFSKEDYLGVIALVCSLPNPRSHYKIYGILTSTAVWIYHHVRRKHHDRNLRQRFTYGRPISTGSIARPQS